MTTRHITALSLASSFILSMMIAGAANAAPAGVGASQVVHKPLADVYSTETQAHKNLSAPGSIVDEPTRWFDTLDALIKSHSARAEDHFVLRRTIQQDPKRLKEWIQAADRVAKNYRELAIALKALPIPASMSGIEQYRDYKADWYNDAASIYEDLIKPRRPSRTMEELQSTLDQIQERSRNLSATHKSLMAMDASFRKTYKVHQQNDALRAFTSDFSFKKQNP